MQLIWAGFWTPLLFYLLCVRDCRSMLEEVVFVPHIKDKSLLLIIKAKVLRQISLAILWCISIWHGRHGMVFREVEQSWGIL